MSQWAVSPAARQKKGMVTWQNMRQRSWGSLHASGKIAHTSSLAFSRLRSQLYRLSAHATPMLDITDIGKHLQALLSSQGTPLGMVSVQAMTQATALAEVCFCRGIGLTKQHRTRLNITQTRVGENCNGKCIMATVGNLAPALCKQQGQPMAASLHM